MLLINRILSNEISIWIFAGLQIALAIFLQIVCKYQLKKNKGLKLWRIFCFIPLTLSLLHFVIFRFHGPARYVFNLTKYYYGLIYLASLIEALPALVSLFPKINRIFLPLASTFCILASFHTVCMPLVWESAMRNNTGKNMKEAFISATEEMEKYYSLKEWKEIDIAALRDRFMPVIEKAQETRDYGLYVAAVQSFTHYFYDGHVSAIIPDYDNFLRALELEAGNDYGFSMVRLDNGETIAVNVKEESQAWEAGIRNKTTICGWNNVKIDEAIAQTDFIYNTVTLPVKAIEDRLRPMMLATKGLLPDGQKGLIAELLYNSDIKADSERPTAVVTFINKNGQEETVELKALGSGIDSLEWAYCPIFWHEYNRFPNLKNHKTAMINEDTAYMVRYNEQANKFYDILSYFTNHNPKAKKDYIKELEERKAEGMKKLIIDCRDNRGGFWALGVELASLFTTESFDIAKRGSEVGGKKQILQTVRVDADGRFSDIQVLILTDVFCVSAGDSFVKILSHCPNVKVMGITPSNCSCQETGGLSFLTDNSVLVYYPVNWLYEVNEDRYIDTTKSRECTIPIDYQIPWDYDFINSLYTDIEDRDVILDYAVEFLKDF